MKDPVFKKLKDDADLVLSELFLAITHRPARGNGVIPATILLRLKWPCSNPCCLRKTGFATFT